MKHFYKLLFLFMLFAAPVAGVAQSKPGPPSNPTAVTTKTVCDSVYFWQGLMCRESKTYIDPADSNNKLNLTLYPPLDISITPSADTTFCGSGVLAVDSVIPNYNYIWRNRTETLSIDTTMIEVFISETYFVTAIFSDSTGQVCSKSDSITITVNQPTYAPYDISICESEVPYTWINGIAYYESNDTATYKLTNSVGCDSVVTLHLTVLTPSVALNSMDNITVCEGGDINLEASLNGTASGAVTYSWSGPDGFTSTLQNPTISNANSAKAGTYTVVATASYNDNCYATDTTSVVITVNTPAVTLNNLSDITVCVGGDINLEVSLNGTESGDTVTYSWSGPNFTSTEQTPTIHNASSANAGTYTVTATASFGNGCDASDSMSVVITVNTPSVALNSMDSITVCAGSDINLEASLNGTESGDTVTYSWSGPNGFVSNLQNPIISNASSANAGTYTVVATASYNDNCYATDTTSVVVTVNTPSVTLNDLSDITVCTGSTINLSATPIGTTSGDTVTYSWRGPNSFTSYLQNPTISDAISLNNGTYKVTATASFSNGCQATDTMSVDVIVNTPFIVLNDMADITVCAGSDINFEASLNGTESGDTVTYSWSGPNFTSTAQTPTIYNASSAEAGTYTVVATASYNDNCYATDTTSVVIMVNTPSVTLNNLSDITICVGGDINLEASLNETASGTVTYSWSGPNFTSTEQIPTIHNASSANVGEYTVVATASYNDNCYATDTMSVDVTVNTPSVALNSMDSITVCSGNDINLNASFDVTPSGNTVTYSWAGPNFTSTEQTPTIHNASSAYAGTYTVTATASYGNGCDASDSKSVTVTVNTPSVTLNDLSDITVCTGSTINLSATPVGTTSGTVSYSWNGPNGFTSSLQNPTISDAISLNTGTYRVTATASFSSACQKTDTMSVNVTVNPTYTTTDTAVICRGYNYNFFGQMLNEPGEYSHILQSANGCDSIILNLHLTVNTPGHTAQTVEACSSYTWIVSDQQMTYTTSGLYTYTHLDFHGCPQVDTLHLTIYQIPQTFLSAEICQGESYNFFGQTLNQTGVYTDTLQTVHQCDSVIILNLTVHPIAHSTIYDSICDGSTYDCFCGQQHSTAGPHVHTLQGEGMYGCDSIVTLYLSIVPMISDIKDIVCKRHADSIPYMLVYPDTGYFYQWYYMEGDTTVMIPGENKQYYAPKGGLNREKDCYYKVRIAPKGFPECGVFTDCWKDTTSTTTKMCILPNPNDGQFRLIIPEGAVNVQILNVNGQVVMTRKVEGGEVLEMNTDLANGLYFVKTFRKDGNFNTEKLVINR